MNVTRWTAGIALVLGLLVVAIPSIRAQSLDEGSESVEVAAAEPFAGEETDRWWGAVGAAICGAELWLIRSNPVVGLNPYVLAGGLAGCVLAAIDVMTTK